MVGFIGRLSYCSRLGSQPVIFCLISYYFFLNIHLFAFFIHSNFPKQHRSLLGDSHSQRQLYDCYKRLYAEMLFRWNLLVPRAKILKYLSVNTEIYRDVEYVTECTNCARVTKAPLCKECRKPLLKCVICRLPVKGLANACLNCGHGGHTLHMQVWFSVNTHIRSSLTLIIYYY